MMILDERWGECQWWFDHGVWWGTVESPRTEPLRGPPYTLIRPKKARLRECRVWWSWVEQFNREPLIGHTSFLESLYQGTASKVRWLGHWDEWHPCALSQSQFWIWVRSLWKLQQLCHRRPIGTPAGDGPLCLPLETLTKFTIALQFQGINFQIIWWHRGWQESQVLKHFLGVWTLWKR